MPPAAPQSLHIGVDHREFSHSYVNHLVTANVARLEQSGQRVFALLLGRPSGGGGFVGADGVPLAPYHIKFRTRPQGK